MITKNINDTQVKTEDGWIISVRNRPYGDFVEVWIARQDHNGIGVCHFEKNGRMEISKLKEGLEPEATMKINSFIWDGIRQAINGVEETPQKQALDAELKATKYHLEDMREIVKVKLLELNQSK